MADKKITELPELNSLSDDDLLVVLDDPSVAPSTYKITAANILSYIDSATSTLTNKTLTSPVINTPTGDVVTPTGTQTLTNKTIDADGTGNSITNIEAADIKNRTRNIFIGTGDFNAGASGTPVLAASNGGNAYAWLFDAAGTEDIWATCGLPEDFVTGNVTLKLWWSMETATTGNVVLQAQVATLRDGVAVGSIAELLNHSQTVEVPGTADTIKVTSFNTFTGTAGDALRVRILRLGADGSDNASDDLCVYAVELEYTADM